MHTFFFVGLCLHKIYHTLSQGTKFHPDKRTAPYKEIVRENEQFIKYYKVCY